MLCMLVFGYARLSSQLGLHLALELASTAASLSAWDNHRGLERTLPHRGDIRLALLPLPVPLPHLGLHGLMEESVVVR